MKTHLISALTLSAALTTGAMAATIDELPAGNSWDQAVVAQYFPALADEATWEAVDVDGDNMVSRNELQAAVDKGLI